MRGSAGPPGEKSDKGVDGSKVIIFRLVMLTKRLAYYVYVQKYYQNIKIVSHLCQGAIISLLP